MVDEWNEMNNVIYMGVFCLIPPILDLGVFFDFDILIKEGRNKREREGRHSLHKVDRYFVWVCLHIFLLYLYSYKILKIFLYALHRFS